MKKFKPERNAYQRIGKNILFFLNAECPHRKIKKSLQATPHTKVQEFIPALHDQQMERWTDERTITHSSSHLQI